MKKHYDRHDAKRLVPLLEDITREIADRLLEIQRLETRIERMRSSRRAPDRLNAQAELAMHRREIRMAGKEIEALGCVSDEENPTEVLIPGRDGNLEHGFRWQFGESGIHAAASDSSVT